MVSSPLQIANGMVVSFDYVLKLDDGDEIDRSGTNTPLIYLHGAQNIISGLERTMTGLGVGDEKRVMVKAADGYGEYDPKNKRVIQRQMFPKGFEFEEGISVEMYDQVTDKDVKAVIDSVLSDKVVLDLNHPLAGENLFFAVKVVDIRHATREEIAHGQVH